MFEWDEAKRHATLSKHGIDFIDAVEVFAQPHLRLPARSEIEPRQIAIGIVNGIPVAVIFTIRDDVIRIITARRARRHEREHYQIHVAGTDPAHEGPDGLEPPA